jgi:hypothetical protein
MTLSKTTKPGRSKRAKAAKQLTPAELFFYDHAGYSYKTGEETPEQGRIRCAKDLAEAESIAARLQWFCEWEWDNDIDDSWMDEEERAKPHEWLCVRLMDGDKVLQALGGIVDPDNDYRRVVEAELADEELSERDKAREAIRASVQHMNDSETEEN